MNPDVKACYRKEGPNCRHRGWISSCRRYPGLMLPGGVTDCSYYEPKSKWHQLTILVKGIALIIFAVILWSIL